MHLVHGGLGGLADMPAGEADERISPGDHIAAGLRGVADEIIGEDGAPGIPVLGIQIAAIPGLELLDRLNLVDALEIAGMRRACVTGCGAHVSPWWRFTRHRADGPTSGARTYET